MSVVPARHGPALGPQAPASQEAAGSNRSFSGSFTPGHPLRSLRPLPPRMNETHTGIWEEFGTIEWKVGFFLTAALCVSIEPPEDLRWPVLRSAASISAIPANRGMRISPEVPRLTQRPE